MIVTLPIFCCATYTSMLPEKDETEISTSTGVAVFAVSSWKYANLCGGTWPNCGTPSSRCTVRFVAEGVTTMVYDDEPAKPFTPKPFTPM